MQRLIFLYSCGIFWRKYVNESYILNLHFIFTFQAVKRSVIVWKATGVQKNLALPPATGGDCGSGRLTKHMNPELIRRSELGKAGIAGTLIFIWTNHPTGFRCMLLAEKQND